MSARNEVLGSLRGLPLKRLFAEAEVKPSKVILSIATGTAALGSAVALAATAAWLIARAAQMPSPADLALAAVSVRMFGIGRGLFRYLERLVSHDTALGGVVALRTKTYERVAASGASTVLSFKRGDIVSRMGSDIDAMGDAVVRALIPVGVAGTVSVFAVVITTFFMPLAGLSLLLCLVAAGALSGLATWRSARLAAEATTTAAAGVAMATLEAIEGAVEHRVWGTTAAARDELRSANRSLERALELAAKPSGWSAAVLQAAQGSALILGVWLAVSAATDAGLAPTSAAVIALLPLSAFEAVSAVPAASLQAFRSASAARRVLAVSQEDTPSDLPAVTLDDFTLTLSGLSAAWPGMNPTRPVDAVVAPGGALGIVGKSGIGKTTLLLTIAGTLKPAAGTATIGTHLSSDVPLGQAITITPEDAHVFGTTVLENLRVARGDITEAQSKAALEAVGLSEWIESLPEGLNTVLGAGGNSVSGGERRRLLLARALLTESPIVLIDEPAEHLDTDGIDALRALVAQIRAQGRSVVIVTHDLGILDAVDEVRSLDVP